MESLKNFILSKFKFKKRTGAIRIENGLKCGNWLFPWLLLLPAFLTWCVFWLYVNFNSIILSFKNATGDWTSQHYEWVFKSLFGQDGENTIGVALRNTCLYFFINYFIVQTANVLLAYFFYKKITGFKVLRFLVYIPNLFAGIFFATIYKELIAFDGPIMDWLLEIGWITKRYQLLADHRYAMTLSLVYSLWLGVGATMVYSMGAMARIPQELLEAAMLDGITPWREFINIILPMIGGTLTTLYVIGAAGFLTAGGATLFLTGGNYGTQTLTFWIFWQVYTGGSTGTSSALGICMTLFTLPLTLFVKWLGNKLTPEVSF